MHLEMAASLPAAEACDVHVVIESPATSAIRSIFLIFMVRLLWPFVRGATVHRHAGPARVNSSMRDSAWRLSCDPTISKAKVRVTTLENMLCLRH